MHQNLDTGCLIVFKSYILYVNLVCIFIVRGFLGYNNQDLYPIFIKIKKSFVGIEQTLILFRYHCCGISFFHFF